MPAGEPSASRSMESHDLFSDGPVVLIVWRHAPGWPVEMATPNITELLGYQPSELLAPSFRFRDIIHPDDLFLLEKEVRSHLASKAPQFERVYRIRSKNGVYRWIRDDNRPVYGPTGFVERIRAWIWDYTPLKQAEAELARQRSRLEEVQSLARLGHWEANLLTGNLWWSETIYDIFGQDPRTFTPSVEAFNQALHPEDVPLVRESEARAMETGRHDIEHRIILPTGEVRWVHELATSEKDEQGRLVRLMGTIQDITERKQAGLALAESSCHTQAILDNVIDGIITIDQERIVTSLNRAAERIFGYSAEEVLGQNVNMLMPEPYHSEHDGYVTTYMKTGATKIIGIGREVEAQRKNGEVFPMELAVSEITRNSAKMFIGVVRDITERKRMERMKNEFVATVSHELRTPLTSISGPIGLLLGGALGEIPEAARRMLEVAHKNSQRLGALINDLLDMEKIAAGKMCFEIRTQEATPLVEQAIQLGQPQADLRRVILALGRRGEGTLIRVDGQRLLQVLTNFLSNAVKFTPKEGTVRVDVLEHEDMVRIQVNDDGPGIPKDFQERIFEKFSQADSSTTRAQSGTGLGLAIAKELTEKMGGRIGFKSEEGRGATFYVDLPRMKKET